MARRRTKRKTPRRSKQGISLLNVAEGFVIGNAATRGIFGTDLIPFLTEGWLKDYTPTQGVGGGGAGNSWGISAAEIFKTLTGQSNYGINSNYMHQTLGAVVKRNIEANGAKSVATIVLTPIAFRVGKNLARRPINMTNRALKKLGVASTVRV